MSEESTSSGIGSLTIFWIAALIFAGAETIATRDIFVGISILLFALVLNLSMLVFIIPVINIILIPFYGEWVWYLAVAIQVVPSMGTAILFTLISGVILIILFAEYVVIPLTIFVD